MSPLIKCLLCISPPPSAPQHSVTFCADVEQALASAKRHRMPAGQFGRSSVAQVALLCPCSMEQQPKQQHTLHFCGTRHGAARSLVAVGPLSS